MNDLTSDGERAAALKHDLHEVVGEITSGQIETEDGTRQRVTIVDRHEKRRTISNVEEDARSRDRGVMYDTACMAKYIAGYKRREGTHR